MRALITVAAAMTCLPLVAQAGEARPFLDLSASSMLIDRSEQLSGEVLEATAGLEVDVSGVTVYGAFHRILPVGNDQSAFDDEADYVIGAAWEGRGYSADVSANWLTFPGQDSEASLELAGEIALDRPLTPTLAGFYDVDFEDWGLELTAGPEWERGDWTLYTIGRAGFVKAGDGSVTRTYGGAEMGAARPFSERVEIGFYIRAEASDEPSFVRRIEAGEAISFRNSGIATGVSLSFSQ